MVKNICTLANQKGRSGENNIRCQPGAQSGLRDAVSCLVDFDPQGQCATSLAINPEPGAFNALVNPHSDIHQWIRDTGRNGLGSAPRGPLHGHGADRDQRGKPPHRRDPPNIQGTISREYDYIIFDTAPSVGGIQERAIYAADLVLIPTATEFLAMDGLAQMVELLNTLKEKTQWRGELLGILPTFFDEQTSESGKSLKELQEGFGDSVLPPIHRATILRECAAEGKTIFEMAPASRASREYEELGRLVIKRA